MVVRVNELEYLNVRCKLIQEIINIPDKLLIDLNKSGEYVMLRIGHLEKLLELTEYLRY